MPDVRHGALTSSLHYLLSPLNSEAIFLSKVRLSDLAKSSCWRLISSERAVSFREGAP